MTKNYKVVCLNRAYDAQQKVAEYGRK